MKCFVWIGLAVLILSRVSAGVPDPVLSPEPGRYPCQISVHLTPEPGTSVSYRFLESSESRTFPWTDPLVLGAMDGESRTYTVRITSVVASGESVTKDFRYQIQCQPNLAPTIEPPPGPYTSAVRVKVALPTGWTLFEDGKTVQSPVVLDALPGDQRIFLLQAQGPGDQVTDWPYSVDRRDQELESLELVSPSPGAWANAQPLVAVFRGVDKVIWSWGSQLDPKHTMAYQGPVLLEKPGVQTVTVGARSRATGQWMKKTVTWTNGTAPVPVKDWPVSGVFNQPLDLPGADGYDLSWDNGLTWTSGKDARREDPSPVSSKVLTVEIRKDGLPSRYTYWMDPRIPQVPKVQFFGGWNPMVTFSGSMEALYRVTWTLGDGKQLEEPEGLWGPVGGWKVPDGAIAARVSAVGLNGLNGGPSTVGFALTGWSIPEWEPWGLSGPLTDRAELPLGGIILPRPGFKAVYEISDKPEVPEPDSRSPLVSGAFLPSVPPGADRTFYARFAWRDAGGLTGPSSAPVTLRVNRIPPASPEVVVSGGSVLVRPAEGEEPGTSVFWAVSPGRVASAEGLSFQPYRQALDLATLRTGVEGTLWFHAQVVDRFGNTGLARLNVALTGPGATSSSSVVEVNPDPSVGESPVEDGGVYPWAQFRLRSLESEKGLWVGISDAGAGVPTDWKVQVQPWVGVVSRSVGKGGRASFLVYWNAKSGDGWAWPQPKTLTLTLDQGPPAALKTPVTWPSEVLKDPWTLEIQPGQPGDLLKYTYTLDGSVPPDPLLTGAVWKGASTWEAPPTGRIGVRVRLTAVSVAGLAEELPPIGPVIIDRTPPPPVNPPIQSFTYWAGSMTVPLPSAPGPVRFSLTTDGSVPPIPGDHSEAIPSEGLVLPGISGQTTLYRFRWRPYSLSGIPGNVTETYSVLVDKPLAQSSEMGNPSSPKPIPAPRISGVPESGISASPVTLTAVWPLGTLRFEVREGAGTPPPVTDQSPVWTSDLILDGGSGVDRTFAVSVRGFSPDGRPLTPETRCSVRVDRVVPEAPSVILLGETRRPSVDLRVNDKDPNPEETLWYRWYWESYPTGSGQSDWLPLKGGPAVFDAPGGALTRVRVQAYYRDVAGNEGPVTEALALVDQNVVYVGAGGEGDGTRERPARSLVGAVDLARRTGRSIVMMATGSYPVDRTVVVGGLQFYGGLNPDSWDQTTQPERSVWTVAGPFSGDSFLYSEKSDWSLSGIDLAVAGTPFDQVVKVDQGKVSVKNSHWTWADSHKGWVQNGGSLDISGVSIDYTALPLGTFLGLTGAVTSLKGVEINATQNQGGRLVSLTDCQALVQDLVMDSRKCQDYDSLWTSTGGHLVVDNARFLAGEGAARATAFVMKDTDATFWNSKIDLSGAVSNTGFQTSGGRLELQMSSLNLLSGSEFNQGLVADHGDLILANTDITIASGTYQGGLDVNAGSLTMGTCSVRLAGGGQKVWGARFPDTTAVKLADVTWKLDAKTPGDLWIVQKPWASGSSVNRSQTPGW